MSTSPSRSRRRAALLALAAALTVAAPIAEARPGGGGSMGSRGSRTYTAPSATPTAPGGGMTMQRSQTAPSLGMNSPGMANPGMQPSGRRFGGGFFAGLLGAGLLGALFGSSFFGGLGGLASMLGMLLQVGLLVVVVMLALRFFRRRNEPAAASYARTGPGGPNPGMGGPQGGATGGSAAAPMGAAPRQPQMRQVQIGPNDYQAFEKLLGDIQDAFSREDRVTLSNLTTPEMVGYFDEELQANAARGVVNRVSDVKLLQGDLAEAWGEDRTDFATVAMRYSLKDVTVERGSGRIVANGDPEAVELWTFQRQPGRAWVLSAIQQTR
ncbi:TIM44-like domain-containing protein [Methylobacterium sp. J-076]|uniref:TIM44-like domain-containing protein n=1 Tax=Methylobacterium sp. J-076 TaxID=2836655 RepID=UPI001FB998F6|nr:TIM44-like domain-containing protein [Methylobacterium sp. J-076]MCJ2015793.1 TIM44-like domain-containing protein [Methylobacterium sp. J-076]